jgi:hypothetical protein
MLGSAKEQSMSDEQMVEVRTPTWRERVASERDELKARRERLRAFIEGPEFSSLDVVDRGLLKLQHSAMSGYEDILTQRVERL